jgi:heme exporter protein D
MLAILYVALAVVVLATTYRLIGRVRRRRWVARDPLAQVFRPHELRELDAHLEQIAANELRRMDAAVVKYMAGAVGHVVDISEHPSRGIALALSDGHQLTLGVVSVAARRQLLNGATSDKLRPARVERNSLSYRLLLRGDRIAEIEIHARRVILTP